MKEGGLFTILDNCLQKISDFSKTNEIRVIALVCDENLFKYPNIEYIAFPKAKKSWIARLYYEYIYFNKLTKILITRKTTRNSIMGSKFFQLFFLIAFYCIFHL